MPFLDLLLSVTSFPDGRTAVYQVPGMQDYLSDLSSLPARRAAAMAVLRNLALNTEACRKMASCERVLSVLLSGLSEEGTTTTAASSWSPSSWRGRCWRAASTRPRRPSRRAASGRFWPRPDCQSGVRAARRVGGCDRPYKNSSCRQINSSRVRNYKRKGQSW